ncbi:RPM1-interacting protein 4-like [Trifolium pratense]|uniref:RPM1-interacting protein 4-like n=1 Tax=Trifolium pratense TaxID=57577 RepID=A0A2K3PE51_TRIPR|nr:RPM1-interacting protein 4-like [Trifolium pratense]
MLCNIDVAFPCDTDKVGIGMCLRDDPGRFLTVKTLWVSPKLLDCVGEAIALPHSVLWTMELELDKDKGRPLPKFGEWDVNDPASAEGFTVIFNKARDEKKTGGNPESPGKTATEPQSKPAIDPGKPQNFGTCCAIIDCHYLPLFVHLELFFQTGKE